jgi:hypothetical protein
LGDEVAAFGEDVGVVLDDDDGVAFVHEAVEDVDEAFHVGHVQADGGFFDGVEVALGVLEAADEPAEATKLWLPIREAAPTHAFALRPNVA